MRIIEIQNKILAACMLDISCLDKVFARFNVDDFTDIRKNIIEKLVKIKESNSVFEIDLFNKQEQSYIIQTVEKEVTTRNLTLYLEQFYEISSKEKIKNTIKSIDFETEDYKTIENKITRSLEKQSTVFETSKIDIQSAFKDFYEETEKEFFNIDLGFDKLNKLCVFDKGDLILIAANTGMGKTAFGLDLLLRSTTIGGHKALFVSLEMATSQVLARIISNITQIDIDKLKRKNRKYLTDVEWAKIGATQEKLQNKIDILDTSNTNVNHVIDNIKSMDKINNYDLIMIDYLQLISDTGKSRYEIITNVSLKMKKLARELEKPVICIAQLNRENVKRADKKPMLTDLKDSSQLEQDCSIGILLHSDEYHDKENKANENVNVTVYIDKNRNGAIGKMECAFLRKFQAFEEI